MTLDCVCEVGIAEQDDEAYIDTHTSLMSEFFKNNNKAEFYWVRVQDQLADLAFGGYRITFLFSFAEAQHVFHFKKMAKTCCKQCNAHTFTHTQKSN